MTPINMADDARILAPAEMAARLAELSADAEADYYGNGGAVAAFERQVAEFLGKERAMMFPTGTLGNTLVLQRLSGGAPARIVVHRDSHLFNDAGDNLAQLAGLCMVPLDGKGAGFSAQALRSEMARTASARIASRIGAVVIESPSRRRHGQRFGNTLGDVLALAQEAGLPLFLGGARMLIECTWTGQSPAAMAAPFDAVYLSLYKYLSAPFGCVIAGPEALFDGLHHERRRFGGSPYQMWPAAVLAADALPRQQATWAEARAVGAVALARMREIGIPVTVPDGGCNVFLVDAGARSDAVVKRAREAAIAMLPPGEGVLALKINETWIGQDPNEIAARLGAVLEGA